MWMLCGDMNTSRGSLLTWKSPFEKDSDGVRIYKAFDNDKANKPGDYRLSQGFSAIHVESTIGASQKSNPKVSDAHDMVTLHGVSKRF